MSIFPPTLPPLHQHSTSRKGLIYSAGVKTIAAIRAFARLCGIRCWPLLEAEFWMGWTACPVNSFKNSKEISVIKSQRVVVAAIFCFYINSQKRNVFDVYFYDYILPFFQLFGSWGYNICNTLMSPIQRLVMSAEGLLFLSRGFEPSSWNTLELSLVIRTHLSYSLNTLSPMYFKLLQQDSHSHFCWRKRLFC